MFPLQISLNERKKARRVTWFLHNVNSSVPYGWLFPKCAAVIHHGGR